MKANLDIEKIKAARNVYFDYYKMRQLEQKIRLSYKANKLSRSAEYFEVPPGEFNKYITSIAYDAITGISILQHKKDTTVIKLPDFISGNISEWTGMIAQGTAHACENSKRLVFDLRSNNGGSIPYFLWAVRHLFPDRSLDPASGNFVMRDIHTHSNTETMMRDAFFLYGAQLFFGLPSTACTGISDGIREYFPSTAYSCAIDAQTNDIFGINDFFWFNNIVQEQRGQVTEDMTPLWTFDARGLETLNPIQCPGKFEDDNLILITDGRNASGGYFFPEKINDQAVIVTTGGYLGEDIAYGNARGGNVINVNNVVDNHDFIDILFGFLNDVSGTTLFPEVRQFPLPGFTRDLNASYEEWGAYTKDLETLTIETPPVPDLQVPIWTSDPMTDGYYYEKVLKAIK